MYLKTNMNINMKNCKWIKPKVIYLTNFFQYHMVCNYNGMLATILSFMSLFKSILLIYENCNWQMKSSDVKTYHGTNQRTTWWMSGRQELLVIAYLEKEANKKGLIPSIKTWQKPHISIHDRTCNSKYAPKSLKPSPWA